MKKKGPPERRRRSEYHRDAQMLEISDRDARVHEIKRHQHDAPIYQNLSTQILDHRAKTVKETDELTPVAQMMKFREEQQELINKQLGLESVINAKKMGNKWARTSRSKSLSVEDAELDAEAALTDALTDLGMTSHGATKTTAEGAVDAASMSAEASADLARVAGLGGAVDTVTGAQVQEEDHFHDEDQDLAPPPEEMAKRWTDGLGAFADKVTPRQIKNMFRKPGAESTKDMMNVMAAPGEADMLGLSGAAAELGLSGALSGLPAQGYMLTIDIIEAQDLQQADVGSKSDPFVEVEFGLHKTHSKVIDNTLEPVWNERHHLLWVDDLPLKVIVKDRDEAGLIAVVDDAEDDLLGTVDMPVEMLQEKLAEVGASWEEWFELEHGRIHLRLVKEHLTEEGRRMIEKEEVDEMEHEMEETSRRRMAQARGLKQAMKEFWKSTREHGKLVAKGDFQEINNRAKHRVKKLMKQPGLQAGFGPSLVMPVFVLGDDGVGKTTFTRNFMRGPILLDEDPRKYKPTFAPNFLEKKLPAEFGNVIIQMWDIPGDKRFARDLARPFMDQSGVCILMYDVTSRKSFEAAIKRWRFFFKVQAKSTSVGSMNRENPTQIILVGNKQDHGKRVVTRKEAVEWCMLKGRIPFYEISLKSQHNCKALQLYIHQVAYHFQLPDSMSKHDILKTRGYISSSDESVDTEAEEEKKKEEQQKKKGKQEDKEPARDDKSRVKVQIQDPGGGSFMDQGSNPGGGSFFAQDGNRQRELRSMGKYVRPTSIGPLPAKFDPVTERLYHFEPGGHGYKDHRQQVHDEHAKLHEQHHQERVLKRAETKRLLEAEERTGEEALYFVEVNRVKDKPSAEERRLTFKEEEEGNLTKYYTNFNKGKVVAHEIQEQKQKEVQALQEKIMANLREDKDNEALKNVKTEQEVIAQEWVQAFSGVSMSDQDAMTMKRQADAIGTMPTEVVDPQKYIDDFQGRMESAHKAAMANLMSMDPDFDSLGDQATEHAKAFHSQSTNVVVKQIEGVIGMELGEVKDNIHLKAVETEKALGILEGVQNMQAKMDKAYEDAEYSTHGIYATETDATGAYSAYSSAGKSLALEGGVRMKATGHQVYEAGRKVKGVTYETLIRTYDRLPNVTDLDPLDLIPNPKKFEVPDAVLDAKETLIGENSAVAKNWRKVKSLKPSDLMPKPQPEEGAGPQKKS